MFCPEKRVANLRSCAELFKISDINFDNVTRSEKNAQAAFDPKTSPPTIGFELEVPHENIENKLGILPLKFRTLLNEGISIPRTLDENLTAACEIAAKPSYLEPVIRDLRMLTPILPKSEKDLSVFWEFNSQPANHYTTVEHELHLALKSGAIPQGPLPLHVTLGIDSTQSPDKRHIGSSIVHYIARAAELINQRPDRIRDGLDGKIIKSSHRWQNSVKHREVYQSGMILPEFRALRIANLQPQLLQSIQMMGWLASREDGDIFTKILPTHTLHHQRLPLADVSDYTYRSHAAAYRQWHAWADYIESSKDSSTPAYQIRQKLLGLSDQLALEFESQLN